jgi:DNA-binding GntR family transcriptional regulator
MATPTKRQHTDHEAGEGARLGGRRAAAQLRNEIVNGTLSPGARLRQEEIAERFGLSRIPIREALHQLEAEGLVVLIPNSGAWVAKIDLRECIEIYKIRERIEPLILAECIPFVTDEDVAELEALAAAVDASTSVEEFLQLDRQLHLTSYKRSPLPTLQTLVTGYWNKTQHYRRAYTTALGSPQKWVLYAEHPLLLEAIRNRDAEEAERVLLGHIRRTRMFLTRHPELFG